MKPGKILVIQTAFIGDVVLALPVPQALRKKFPESEIHFLLRKGNESLLDNHPSIDKVWIWDKNNNKNYSLIKLIIIIINQIHNCIFWTFVLIFLSSNFDYLYFSRDIVLQLHKLKLRFFFN